MFKECRQQNPPHANFCCRCGQRLDTTGSCRPESRRKRRSGGGGWLLLLVLLFSILGLHKGGCVSWPRWQTSPAVEQFYELAPPKAAALYHLLAPRDVRVLVRRSEGRVSVKGTEREIAILDGLVALLNRVDCQSEGCLNAYMARARHTWTTSRQYKLSRQKAAALFNLLAFDDVPVLVSGRKSKVRVEASPDDQKTIWHVVNILKGHRRP